MAKKVGIVLGAIVGLLFLVMLLAPLIYDVDKNVRPKIVTAIEESLNAKADIGKLSLSLFGGVSVGIESLKLMDLSSKTIFEMKDAKLKIPFWALLTGKLKVTIVAEGPTLNVSKDRKGQLNVLKLIKETKAEVAPPEKEDEGTGSSGAVAGAGSRLFISTEINNATLNYKDLKTGMSSKIENLTFITEGIGLNRPFDLEMVSDIAVSDKKGMAVNGKLSLEGTIEVRMSQSGFEMANLEADLDLSELAIRYGALFNKDAGVPLTLEADLSVSPNMADLKSIAFEVNGFKILTAGTVKNFSSPVFDIKVNSNELKLGQWKKILQPVREFDLAGKASFDFALGGSLKSPKYSGNLSLAGASLKVPGLYPRATDVNSKIKIATNRVDLKDTQMRMGKSDLKVSGSVRGFSAPRINVEVRSKLFDIDELLGPASKSKKPVAKNEKELSEAELDRQMEQMAAGPIKAIKSNPTLRKMHFVAGAKIQKLRVKNVDMTDFVAGVEFKKLVLSLKKASLKTFGGSMNANMSVDFNGKDPAYRASGKATNLDVDAAVKSQMKELKEVITGRAFADFNISGSGVAPSKVKKRLLGSGSFNIKNGTWSALSPLKMIGEKLKKIPQVGAQAGKIKVGNRFKTFKGKFHIKNSRLNLENAVVDLDEARTAVTLKGYVAFNMTMNMKGNVVAPINVPRKLRTKDGRGKIPFELYGPLKPPKVRWESTLNPVAKAYAEEAGKKAAKKGVESLKKKIKNKQIKKLLDGISF